MPMDKQNINLPFAAGIDTKTDAFQVQPGKLLSLQNAVFNKGGMLQKRNGYGSLASLPSASPATYLTTFNGNLTAIGTAIQAYGTAQEDWVSKGYIQPAEVSTLPLIRNTLNQSQCDAAVAPNGLVCTVYTEVNAGSSVAKFAVADSITGQNVLAPQLISTYVSAGTPSGPRVFIVGTYFVIVFTNTITATAHLQYIAVSSITPATINTSQDIAAAYTTSAHMSWDGVSVNDNLYVAYNTTAGGQAIKVTYLTQSQIGSGAAPVTPVTFASVSASSCMSVCADVSTPSNPIIYVTCCDSTADKVFLAVNTVLQTVLTPTTITFSGQPINVASTATGGVVYFFFEMAGSYSYDGAIPTNIIHSVSATVAGTVTNLPNDLLGVGLASKAFLVDDTIYFLAAYESPFQPTYFLMNGSLNVAKPIAKLAYQNGGGYLPLGLPGVTVSNDNVVQIPYLYKDLIQSVNKNTNVPAGSQVAGIYSQTGVNLSTFQIGTGGIDTAEIGSNLHITGGFLWMYDGYLPVEHNFFLYPDSVEATGSGTSGSMTAQEYFYQVCYEWADNQGNVFRSAPSIPVSVTLTSDTSVTIDVPTLRMTYKTANPVKIVIYRWSVAQQAYYQVTSLTSPTLNDPTTNSIAYNDKLDDASILGNNLLYTTGGVLEDVNAPASNLLTLFDTRLWLVDAEDPNLLWFSKQVIENTPVEMSDLQTLYVAPTTAAQGSTGPITALSVMDDKLIIFKQNAIYYINGTGPDTTGAQNQYSQPVFITSTVGCSNQQSIVFMPQGLMFQSDKGIWLLGRDLNTEYIGAPVEDFNNGLVQSAVNVPATNQVRFTLSTGQTLMFDYYFNQWGTFVGVSAISACIFENLHTFLNAQGAVLQETPGLYQDAAYPVLMSFQSAWFNLAGLQGYERAYEFYLLGTYLSPHKLNVQVCYDYNNSPQQSNLITPDNYAGTWGSNSVWGSGQYWGGQNSNEQWRIFLRKQKTQAFSVIITEVFDASFGTAPGAGLNLHGLDLTVGVKKGRPSLRASRQVG